MQALGITNLSEADQQALMDLYRITSLPGLPTRVHLLLLSFEQGLKVAQLAQIVREIDCTVQRWLKPYQAEGIKGLWDDGPRSGKQAKVTPGCGEQLRPRSLGLAFSLWTLVRLADYLAQQTGLGLSDEAVRQHLKASDIVLSPPQQKISSPDAEYLVKKSRLKIKAST